MFHCILLVTTLGHFFGGGFTPTDMTSPPAAGSMPGRWVMRVESIPEVRPVQSFTLTARST